MQTSLIDPRPLKPNPWNTNRVGPDNQAKLRKSIEDLGFVTAVVVRELEDDTLQILGGQHRAEAAIELGLKTIPVLNLGVISDTKAKKIGLVDNSRYGTDDAIGLAQLYEEIGMSAEQLASFLPFSEVDFEMIAKSVEIDLDALDLLTEDGDEDDAPMKPRPAKTHELLRFRVSLGDAEKIRQLVETTIKHQGLDDGDELTAAGSALALLLLEDITELEVNDD